MVQKTISSLDGIPVKRRGFIRDDKNQSRLIIFSVSAILSNSNEEVVPMYIVNHFLT
jgi:hypothetical protein